MKKIIRKSICLASAGILAFAPLSASALSQEETVYTKLNSDGAPRSTSVIRHLVNDVAAQSIIDRTSLENIENLNGFEAYSSDGDSLTWQANGADIYYQGTSKANLPVEVAISYFLDGNEMAPEDILGKSGHAAIHLKFTNLSRVDDLYTPFVAAVATTLSETSNHNVVVTNGKVTSNGRTFAVAAVAAPGLYESLGLAELKSTSEIVLAYDTDEFSLSDIYIVITPRILGEADLKIFNDIDDLSVSSNQLADSSQKLASGANQLRDGIATLRTAVVNAKTQLASQSSQASLDATLLAQIKDVAVTAAQEKVAAESATVRASIKQQISNNATLQDALKLEAEKLCRAQVSVNCTAESTSQILAQLVSGLEEELFQSSLALAQDVAAQTAAVTAEGVATQLVTSLQNGMGEALLAPLDQLLVGIDRLNTGATELSEGMMQFDRDGIQKLNSAVNSKIKVTSDKIKQLSNLSRSYDNFAGISDDVAGTTKFVLMIEGKSNAK